MAKIDTQQARKLLLATRDKLRDGTATVADHRPALDALIVLPQPEAEQWLEEIRVGFAYVHAREWEARAREREATPAAPRSR